MKIVGKKKLFPKGYFYRIVLKNKKTNKKILPINLMDTYRPEY